MILERLVPFLIWLWALHHSGHHYHIPITAGSPSSSRPASTMDFLLNGRAQESPQGSLRPHQPRAGRQPLPLWGLAVSRGKGLCQEGGCGVCPSGIHTWRAPLFDSHWAFHSPPQTKGLFFSTQRKIPVFLKLMLYLCPNSLNSPRVLASGTKKKKKARDTESSFCFIPCHTLPLRPWTQAINLLDSGMRAVWEGKGGTWRKNTGYSFKNIILASIPGGGN